MKQKTKERIKAWLFFWGFDYEKLKYTLKGFYKFYYKDLRTLKSQKGDDITFAIGKPYPVLNERFVPSGTMRGHYFHQDLYVARCIYAAKPLRHVDVGSRTDGFVAHVAVFRPIEVLDIRPMESKVNNVLFKQADLMQLPAEMERYCDSLSSLHVVEHFGLGRYGDPVNYYGHLAAIENFARMLQPGGTFYFSTPIGPQRIEFNAHRVFSVAYLLQILAPYFEVSSFSFVDEEGHFHENVALEANLLAENYGCTYGCGIFVLTRKND